MADVDESKPLKEVSLGHQNDDEDDPEIALADKVIKLKDDDVPTKAASKPKKTMKSTIRISESSSSKQSKPQLDEDGGVIAREINPNATCYEVDYFRPLFDVDSDDIIGRMKLAVMPWKISGENSGDDEESGEKLSQSPFFAGTKPDFYGPFWIANTLIFALTASGNLSAYFSGDEVDWFSESTKIVTALMLIYSFISLAPFALYCFMKNSGSLVTLTELISLYGYSLTIFIPVSILSVINIEALRVCLLTGATGLSLFMIKKNYWAEVSEKLGEKKLVVVGIASSAHFIFLLMCIFYFFRFDLQL